MLVAEVIVPQMFTAYAEDLGYLGNGLHHFQYFCEECDQAFTSAWGKITGALRYYERGAFFYCTHCGTRHEKNIVYIKRQMQAPYKIRLSVKVFENVINFEASSETVKFQDQLIVYRGKYKEIIRFDIAKQTTLFTSFHDGRIVEYMEIGNPFKLDVLKKSILRFFLPNSIANSNQKSELNRILKVLRENVHRKLEKHLGHKVSSMHVSPGQYYGSFLLPIFNIAYRLMFPDAPNLPTTYREEPRLIENFWCMKMTQNSAFMDDVVRLTRRKTNFVTAMISANALPDKPFIRRAISEDPFEAGLLARSFVLCQNYDYAIRLYMGLKKFGTDVYTRVNDSLLHFLQKMLPLYGEAGVVRLVEEAKEIQPWDCARLYDQLNEENREALKTERVKINELHDWLSLRRRKQTHVNLKFNVPDHIVNRLSMQKARLKFFLPKESMELLDAGTQLHNCVASYGAAMRYNQKWIVLVADDTGKLAACLEIRDQELVQAKIDKNKPAADNPELNAEIIAWANEAKIEIKTTDVKVQTEELMSMTG